MSFSFLKRIGLKIKIALKVIKRFFLRIPVLAISIGDDAVSVLYVNSRKEVIDYNRVELPKDISLKSLQQALEQAGLNEKKSGPRQVFITLPESRVFIDYFTLPLSVPENTLDNEIFKKAAGILPIELQFAYYSYQTRKTDKAIEVLFVASEKPVINKLMKILDEMGIKPSLITAESLCLGYALLGDDIRDRGTMILGIGARAVICSVFDPDNVIKFTTTIPVTERAMNSVLDGVGEALAYSKKKYNLETGNIILTGDISLFPALQKELKAKFKKEAAAGRFDSIPFSLGALEDENLFAAAIGLVSQAFYVEARKKINLLDTKAAKKPKAKQPVKSRKQAPAEGEDAKGAYDPKAESRRRLKQNILSVCVVIFLIFPPVYVIYTTLTGGGSPLDREEVIAPLESQAYFGAINDEFDSLDFTGTKDKAVLRAALDRLEQSAREAIAAGGNTKEGDVLLLRIQNARDKLNNIIRLTGISPYVDFAASGHENPQAAGILGAAGRFVVYEPDAVYEAAPGQAITPQAVSEAEAVIAGAVMSEYELLLFLTDSGRIIEYGENGLKPSDLQRAAADIAVFGRYLYLLVPEENQIYKYARSGSGYTGGSGYNTGADLKGAVSFAIDGSIYILKSDGKIVKLFRSAEEPFEIKNLPGTMAGSTKIFTSEDIPDVYILDPDNKRVVVIRKEDAVFLNQIVFEGLNDIEDIYVDSDGQIFLLTKTALYNLNHKS